MRSKRAAYKMERPNDLPLLGKIVKEGPRKYVCMMTFLDSRRHYHDEVIHADNKAQAKRYALVRYPSLVWKRPKPKLPRKVKEKKVGKVHNKRARATIRSVNATRTRVRHGKGGADVLNTSPRTPSVRRTRAPKATPIETME